MLCERQVGVSVAELRRHHGVSEHTIYHWKQMYGGLETSELRRLKAENARLKRLVAEQALDNQMLKQLLSKKLVMPAAHRAAACHLQTESSVSERLACRLIVPIHGALSRTTTTGRHGTAASTPQFGEGATTLLPSTVACARATGRMAREPQARASDISRRKTDGAAPKTQTYRRATRTVSDYCAHSQRLLESGLHE